MARARSEQVPKIVNTTRLKGTIVGLDESFVVALDLISDFVNRFTADMGVADRTLEGELTVRITKSQTPRHASELAPVEAEHIACTWR